MLPNMEMKKNVVHFANVTRTDSALNSANKCPEPPIAISFRRANKKNQGATFVAPPEDAWVLLFNIWVHPI
jgi:hypothetical protein